MIGLSPFLILIIVLVTAAQLAGNSKRNKEKFKDDTPQSGEAPMSMKKAKDAMKSGEKINADPEPPSFEVDGRDDSNVQGFDVK